MKKHFTFKTIIAGAMIATLLFSMSAIASEKNTDNTVANVGTTTNIEDTANTQDPNAAVQTQYRLVQGKISSVEKDGDYTKIEIENDDMGMIFTAENGVFVIDQKDNTNKTLQDLKKGMEITAVLSNNSIMTMSIPPITPGAVGFIINSEKGFIDLSIYDQDLTNAQNTLQLNIDDKTTIVDLQGSKKIFSQEDLKNNELLVFYGASTRSIPAQTSPSFVMILNSADAPQEGEGVPMPIDAPAAASIPAAKIQPAIALESSMPKPELASLRELTDTAGFTIKWTANDKPIILEKGNTKIEITVGKSTYSLNGEENSFSLETVLKDSKVFVSSELQTVLQ